jgi:hypothetical protein
MLDLAAINRHALLQPSARWRNASGKASRPKSPDTTSMTSSPSSPFVESYPLPVLLRIAVRGGNGHFARPARHGARELMERDGARAVRTDYALGSPRRFQNEPGDLVWMGDQ